MVKLTIHGNVPSQKNRKIISQRKQRTAYGVTTIPFLRSAPAVKEWQAAALMQLNVQWRGWEVVHYPLSLIITFYFDNNRRHDLDNALSSVMDALVAAGVMTDDSLNYVDSITIQYGGYDKEYPRVEIYLDEECVEMVDKKKAKKELPQNTAITNPEDPANRKYKRRRNQDDIVQK